MEEDLHRHTTSIQGLHPSVTLDTVNKLAKHRHPQHYTTQQRNQFAEVLRERIYATITLLAVMVTLWSHSDEHSPWGTIGIIFGTVVALWLATMIAARMSYRIVHSEGEANEKSWEASESARGLLTPAGAPIFFILFSFTGLISLKMALLLGIISLVMSLFLFSLFSGRQSSDSWMKILLYSFLQLALGVGVIALKILVE